MKQIIKSMDNYKSSSPDHIPNKLMKTIFEEDSAYITLILNKIPKT